MMMSERRDILIVGIKNHLKHIATRFSQPCSDELKSMTFFVLMLEIRVKMIFLKLKHIMFYDLFFF